MREKIEALVEAVDALDKRWNIAAALASPEVDELLRANERVRKALVEP